MVTYTASHFFCYYNHGSMNILAKTISELKKEDQMVRRIKVNFQVGEEDQGRLHGTYKI